MGEGVESRSQGCPKGRGRKYSREELSPLSVGRQRDRIIHVEVTGDLTRAVWWVAGKSD